MKEAEPARCPKCSTLALAISAPSYSTAEFCLPKGNTRRPCRSFKKHPKSILIRPALITSSVLRTRLSGFWIWLKLPSFVTLELQPQMAQASAALATLSARKGDHEQALRLAENARKTGPNLSSTYLASAQALLAKADMRQAEISLQTALSRDPVSLSALATLLSLYSRQGRMHEGLRRITPLVQQYPLNAGLHFLQAVAYFDLKDLEKSETSIRQALTLDSRTPDAYTLLANIHFARGAVEEAKADLRSAIAAHPRSLLNYMALVTQYEKEGNWEEAKKLCIQAHDIDPTAPLVAAELAFLYLEHGGDVNTAVSLAQVAKQQLPNSPVTADALGWAYYKMGSPASAITQLKESTEKAPENPIYQYHLGMAYAASRRADLAAQALRGPENRSEFPLRCECSGNIGEASERRSLSAGLSARP